MCFTGSRAKLTCQLLLCTIILTASPKYACSGYQRPIFETSGTQGRIWPVLYESVYICDSTVIPPLSGQPLFSGHCSKSQIYEVRVILPPLSDQPLFNGHCSKSQIYEVRVIAPPLSDQPLFNGHLYESQG